MKTFFEIVELLKTILKDEFKNKKVLDKDIANILDIKQQSFATMKLRNKIPYDKLLSFCALKKISINWLLFDQDPSSLINTTDKYWIKYYSNINASAGGGAFNEEEEFERLEIEEKFIKQLGSDIKNIEAVNVIGDSMEPTLYDGNIIFIDRSKTDIKDGIYAINAYGNFFVKRLSKRINGKIDIISDNKEYPIQTVNLNDITIVGKVIASFGRLY